MIGVLRGTLVRKTPGEAVVDVGGVGYRLAIPLSTFYALGDEGAEVRLEVHTHVREDALQLFGFLSVAERILFERLLGVSGVGPRLAVALLSGMPPEELVPALRARDVGRLVGIPGVGRKTAERLVLELQDKVTDLAAGLPEGEAAEEKRPAADGADEAVSALVNLGYRERDARRAVEAEGRHGGGSMEELLRGALRRLSG